MTAVIVTAAVNWVFAVGAVAIAAAIVVIPACVLSSRISREQEQAAADRRVCREIARLETFANHPSNRSKP